MPRSAESALHVLEAELTHPEATIRNSSILFRERGIVPGVDIVLAKANSAYS